MLVLFWIYHAVRWPRFLSIAGLVLNLGLLALLTHTLSDYLRLQLQAETLSVEVLDKGTHGVHGGQRTKRGSFPKKYKISYRLPSGEERSELVLEEDYVRVRTGEHLPLQRVPGNASLNTLGDAASLGVFAWIFALVFAAVAVFMAVASGVVLDAANERAELLAKKMKEHGLACPKCGELRKDHIFHRKDLLAYAFFFVCKVCKAKFKAADCVEKK